MLDASVQPGRVDVDDQAHAAVERDGQRLGPTHPAAPAGEGEGAGQRPAEVPVGDGRERLERALDDALRADVDPRPGRHLPVHGQPERLQTTEVRPGGPLRHEVGVGDEHARRPLVGLQDPDGLAGLHEQGLVVGERRERADDAVVARPVPGRPTRAAVDDEVVGALGDLGVEVVHEHAQRGLGLPRPGGERGAACGADGAGSDHGVPPRWSAGVGPVIAAARRPARRRAAGRPAADVGDRGLDLRRREPVGARTGDVRPQPGDDGGGGRGGLSGARRSRPRAPTRSSTPGPG